MGEQRTTVYHTEQWRDVLASTYGYKDVSFTRLEHPAIQARSMVVANKILRKRYMISLPFSDEAGPVIPGRDPVLVSAYFHWVDDLIEHERLDYVELKGVEQPLLAQAIHYGFATCFDNYTFRIDLSQTKEDIQSGYHTSIRRNLKAVRQSGIRVVVNDDSLMSSFYELHQMTMKRLGTPPHKHSFFTNMRNLLSEQVLFLYAMLEKEPVSAIVIFLDESGYCARYVAGVTNPKYRSLNSNSLLFDTAIRSAKSRGLSYFDFGVSRPGTGVWEFKRKWTKEAPLKVHYLIKGRAEAYVDPRTNSMARSSNIWKKWIPASFANSVGPHIRGQLAR